MPELNRLKEDLDNLQRVDLDSLRRTPLVNLLPPRRHSVRPNQEGCLGPLQLRVVSVQPRQVDLVQPLRPPVDYSVSPNNSNLLVYSGRTTLAQPAVSSVKITNSKIHPRQEVCLDKTIHLGKLRINHKTLIPSLLVRRNLPALLAPRRADLGNSLPLRRIRLVNLQPIQQLPGSHLATIITNSRSSPLLVVFSVVDSVSRVN